MIDLITIRLIWNSYDFNHAIKEEGGGVAIQVYKSTNFYFIQDWIF